MEKLYIVVRGDLSKSQQAVQAGHALAEYLLNREPIWQNGTLVYLKVKDGRELNQLRMNIWSLGVDFETFQEPDIGNETTALASLGNNKFFRELRMM